MIERTRFAGVFARLQPYRLWNGLLLDVPGIPPGSYLAGPAAGAWPAPAGSTRHWHGSFSAKIGFVFSSLFCTTSLLTPFSSRACPLFASDQIGFVSHDSSEAGGVEFEVSSVKFEVGRPAAGLSPLNTSHFKLETSSHDRPSAGFEVPSVNFEVGSPGGSGDWLSSLET